MVSERQLERITIAVEQLEADSIKEATCRFTALALDIIEAGTHTTTATAAANDYWGRTPHHIAAGDGRRARMTYL